jgi:phosphoribosylaminoimidazole carboxylase PurK protein
VYRGSGSELSRAIPFVERALASGSDVYAETLVPFAFELAVVSSRSLSGNIAQYPAVITLQKSGVCAEVKGPGTTFGLAAETERTAFNYARAIGDRLGMVGTYAVEFFVDQDMHLSVNEIAPRVHNSGHFSLDAAETSQFENHWRAILDLPLGSTRTDDFFAMINIIGPIGYDGQVSQEFAMEADGIRTYWYGKSASRPGRKLGHVNITATSSAQLSEKMNAAKAAITSWQSSLSGEVSRV